MSDASIRKMALNADLARQVSLETDNDADRIMLARATRVSLVFINNLIIISFNR